MEKIIHYFYQSSLFARGSTYSQERLFPSLSITAEIVPTTVDVKVESRQPLPECFFMRKSKLVVSWFNQQNFYPPKNYFVVSLQWTTLQILCSSNRASFRVPSLPGYYLPGSKARKPTYWQPRLSQGNTHTAFTHKLYWMSIYAILDYWFWLRKTSQRPNVDLMWHSRIPCAGNHPQQGEQNSGTHSYFSHGERQIFYIVLSSCASFVPWIF